MSSGSGRLIAGLVVLTAIRLVVAAVMPLAPDETYYWVWSRALARGYLDHPPMVALWIRLGTSLAGATPLGVRLLGPFAAALGAWLLADAANRLFPGRGTGAAAALLLNATLMFSVGAVIMTPDTPLLLFWTATLWAAARLASGGTSRWWLAIGLFAGLAMDSKYTAAFLPLGLALYILSASPGWLRRKEPWMGAALAGLMFLPVVWWNADHDWIGFARQGGRVVDWRPERAITFLGELIGGQFGLATPGVFVLFVVGVAVAVRLAARTREPAWTLLAAFSFPPALAFLQHAFGDRVQGNWPAIIYPAAAIAASGLSAAIWRRLVWPSAGLGFVLTGALYAHGGAQWPVMKSDPVARQLFGWSDFAAHIEAARIGADVTCVVAEPYGVAGELAWSGVSVKGVVMRWSATNLPRATMGDGPCLLIRPERYGARPNPDEWQDVSRLEDVSRAARDLEIERYTVFLARPLAGSSAGILLPVRRP
jgi:4-amino-4-deoxy-L-arabinose transferase-like glycosyltransferase